MIKFRLAQKEFIRYPSKEWDDIVQIDRNIEKIIDIEYAKNLISNTLYKSKINRIKQDIKAKWIYKDSPGHPEDDTEYLYEISEERQGGYLVYSKNIAGDDRFSYIIYQPELTTLINTDEHGNKVEVKVYIIPVYVYSYSEHKRPDGGLYWSPFPEEREKIRREIDRWRAKKNLPPIDRSSQRNRRQ